MFNYGNCLDILPSLPEQSIDLIVTSPPSASQCNSDGDVHPDNYVEWFLPIAAELKRVLKPTGSFVVIIKERVFDGQRHTYVIKLILEMRRQGWLWTEEYCWHKKICRQSEGSDRFCDGWERCLHFTLNKKFAMYQEEVMTPMGDWAKSRLKNLSETDKIRDNSKVGSGFGKNVSRWVGREMAYPDNVLHMATDCPDGALSSVLPTALLEWFIRLFTQPNDVVLDPFMGCGATSAAARGLKRNFVGIEIKREYYELARGRLGS